ncbi:VOC family protein [Saccharopolyspora rhizosphaerae]|uniref:VOC family protein n=1 Tax=Saccharopolyspora rhizosphaerae TaxID=2492662 RepID=A0A3R8Q9W5_9PSEU|nr:VOC family protein [Saccharopolyspora rhizosphaerae]RRO16202.1 VOC family protein [Saccharopolyspora rhizosphaerae]
MGIALGAPGWVDLASRDTEAVREFYTGLLGWRWVQRCDYAVAFADDTPVAAVFAPESDDIPTAWTLYLECGSARRATERVRALGGKVLVPPTETPGHEVFLIAEDPTGAVVGLWEAPENATFGWERASALCWAELHTRDASAADPFYAELLGYRQEQIGQPGGAFDYTVWYVDEQPTLGRFEAGLTLPESTPPHWLLYFQVSQEDDTDSAIAKVRKLGGEVLREPTDSPYGRQAVVRDVVGARFALIDTAQRTGE